MNKLIHLIDFPNFTDERGTLVALESCKTIPFDIKRVYYLFDLKNGISRGFHAHKETRQVAICLNGSCNILMDDGQSRKTVKLDSPNKGLLIDVFQWHEMHDFTDDCILVVLASHLYLESDYIRNYDEFLEVVSK
ncbi:dTDP-6-deoxy-3,4-keto-hexulose isomerase [Vibrio ponticus]|uniref:dTDP-6-deoxy-3,4-keto-hexulose isomerase n=1 Tax=Vibrio ponticus TaxID=265668 RepID=A0ABX3F7R4_9VIBR|nr:FdtA/QdtA family cupin domain-containing protein [Vibrio ponticus]OLQ86636.1 dTDP-6-deoxy-3,4-keto-hexulose isomerase [Vibrio ponticus]